ncbi:32921_t:CDS:10 [Gigaspora margarita]|uniref:32921_t:CDS:1 n=1 Tax=Gigaspora margarita TaxID=4874 RepID=A0ABN7UPT2_GIGMA|nr:32921_t:CDS:10 [Gigaspora margarita]
MPKIMITKIVDCECGTQLLPLEQKNFCCNAILGHYNLPLRPLLSILQNTYMSNFNGVINLQHPHAFTVNGRAYHKIHSANTEGYPVNWFVYDANARNNIVNRYGLNQDIVNLIKQELEAINPFIRANAEIAACTIVHSTAIMQEQCVQIWCINKNKPEYINILNKNYEALQYPLFFSLWQNRLAFHLLGQLFNKYLVDMFSRADDKHLQFIRKEQCRFRKGGQEEDESLGDEAELHPENIYLPASHTFSYRCYTEDITNQFTLPPNTYLEKECIECHQREKYYLRMLLNYCAARSFEDLRKVNRILYSIFQDAAHALELLDDTNEYEQCFAKAISYNCTPGQLCLLFCHLILEEKEKIVCLLNIEQKKIYQEIIQHIQENKPLTVFIYEYNEEGCKCKINPNSERAELIRESSVISWDELAMAQKGNIEADILLQYSNQSNYLLFGTLKVYNLQKPVRNANDLIYSQFMDDIGNGTNRENVTLTFLNTTYKLNDIINFTFPTHILNNPTTCLQQAILCPLNIEVNSINSTILQQVEGEEFNLYSVDNLADNENNNILENQRYQRNIVTIELLNSLNVPGVPKHCLILKCGCIATIM